jgi:hexosaminidase
MAKSFYFLVLSLLVSAVLATVPLWPLPSSYNLGSTTVKLNSAFKLQYSGTPNDLIHKTIDRYMRLLHIPRDAIPNDGEVKTCSLSVVDETIPAIVGADESYSVSITESGSCQISGANIWALMRGLETFTQLLVRGDNQDIFVKTAPATINDKARYGHRGVLIDTSRHYLPVSEIQRIIDTLPANKFNVLHWHTVDAESFPLDTPSEPTMIQGAYNAKMVYTMADLTNLRNYAYERGIEVIFELDVPGHAAAWTKGKPEIMADCFAKYYYNINDFALNPTLDETYATLQNILSDVVKATNTPRLHLGGDEVVYGCWKNDSSIVNWMNQKQWTDYNQLLGYFVDRADKIANNLGASVTHWEEVFTAGATVPANTIFQVWTDSSKMSAVTAAKYPVIASPSNYWYLNIPSNTWQNMYSYDPATGLNADQASRVVGGEGCLWGEYIDETNIEQNIYPRACSVAERLWSPATTTDTTDALNRLVIQKCRLVNRGVRSSPVQPADYCTEIYV